MRRFYGVVLSRSAPALRAWTLNPRTSASFRLPAHTSVSARVEALRLGLRSQFAAFLEALIERHCPGRLLLRLRLHNRLGRSHAYNVAPKLRESRLQVSDVLLRRGLVNNRHLRIVLQGCAELP